MGGLSYFRALFLKDLVDRGSDPAKYLNLQSMPDPPPLSGTPSAIIAAPPPSPPHSSTEGDNRRAELAKTQDMYQVLETRNEYLYARTENMEYIHTQCTLSSPFFSHFFYTASRYNLIHSLLSQFRNVQSIPVSPPPSTSSAIATAPSPSTPYSSEVDKLREELAKAQGMFQVSN